MNHLLHRLHPSLKVETILIVGIQFLSIAFILLTGPWVANTLFLIFAQAVGLFIGIWGYWVMRKQSFSILPNVKHGSKLITHGPFEIIRHPIYAGILLTILILVITYFSYYRVIAFLVIAVDLLFKVHLEEVLLEKHFKEEFIEYKKHTHRLIPYIY